MKSFLQRCFSVLLCVFFTACSSPGVSEAAQSTSTSSVPSPESPAVSPTISYEYCGGLYSPRSSTDSGFYDLIYHSDATGNLLYYDYETMQCVYLSSQPNSDHRDESDTSFVPSVMGGAVVVADSQYIYVIKSTASYVREENEAHRAGFLMRMEHDGQERKTVPLPASTYLTYGSGTATAGDEIFMLLQEVQKDTSEVIYLASLDFNTGSIERRLEFSTDETPFLIGVCSEGPILAVNDHERKQQRLYIYNSQENQLNLIPFDSDAYPYVLDPNEGIIYYLDGNEILRYDSVSQQTRATGCTLPDGDWTDIQFTELVDGHITMSLSTGEEEYESMTISLATGEIFHPMLEDQDRPVIIVAVTPDRYVVKLGGIPIKYQDYTPDGVPIENETVIHHFAMMEKEDYWNNRPNYQEFNNLAYENFSFSN